MKDCPNKPKASENVKGKTMLNLVGVMPSPQTLETEIETVNIPLKVVTRNQAKNVKESVRGKETSPRHGTETPGENLGMKPRRC